MNTTNLMKASMINAYGAPDVVELKEVADRRSRTTKSWYAFTRPPSTPAMSLRCAAAHGSFA